MTPNAGGPRGPTAAGRWQTATVVLATALAGASWALRWLIGGHPPRFLFWNLLLAFVPWLTSVLMRTSRSRWAWVGVAPWLAFFPNAPYLVTDFVHLRPVGAADPWLQLMVFASFALAGCVLGWFSLLNVAVVLRRHLGPAAVNAALVASVWLSGVGMYLGRVDRWNSWDLATRPLDVLAATLATVTSVEGLVTSSVFAGFVGVGALMLAAARADGVTRAASGPRSVESARSLDFFDGSPLSRPARRPPAPAAGQPAPRP